MFKARGVQSVQTISVPYSCPHEAREQIAGLRRVYGSAVRTAYANAVGADGKPLKQKNLRHLVKGRFAGGIADAWLRFAPKWPSMVVRTLGHAALGEPGRACVWQRDGETLHKDFILP